MIVDHETVDGRKVSVEVHEATVRMRIHRGSLMQAAIKDGRPDDESAIIIGIYKITLMPTCVACSSNIQDSDHPDLQMETLTFDQFMDLPDQFLKKWADAVYQLNPSWRDDLAVPQTTPKGNK